MHHFQELICILWFSTKPINKQYLCKEVLLFCFTWFQFWKSLYVMFFCDLIEAYYWYNYSYFLMMYRHSPNMW